MEEAETRKKPPKTKLCVTRARMTIPAKGTRKRRRRQGGADVVAVETVRNGESRAVTKRDGSDEDEDSDSEVRIGIGQ